LIVRPRKSAREYVARSADRHRSCENLTLRLCDGRTLGYAEYGAVGGKPVLVFHGGLGARVQVRVAHAPALARGIRIIAPDRPGQGLSTRQLGRTIADWPGDVRELADALGIARFAVVGISGGGPYAAACASALPERVSRAGIISGVAPGAGHELANGLRRRARGLVSLVLDRPGVTRAVMDLAAVPCRSVPERIFALARALALPADQPTLRRPEVAAALSTGLREAFRQGGQGVADELLLLMQPWTVRLDQIRVPVRLWHGDADAMVPVAMGRYFAQAIPTCRAEFVAGGGHYMVFERIGAFLEAMIERACDSP
jgi:pimeloyl-ACP methyl ester carboxylesterase